MTSPRNPISYLPGRTWIRLIALTALAAACAFGAVTAQLSTLKPSPDLVGSPITLIASSEGADLPVYKFEYRRAGGDWMILRDFMRYTQLVHAPMRPGAYDFRVTVLALDEEGDPIETTTATLPYIVLPRVTSTPAVTATAHPLVALYSVPACPFGFVRVRFVRAGQLDWNYTDLKPCSPGESLNFHIAGMRENTTYNMQHEWFISDSPLRGAMLQHRTGVPPIAFPAFEVTDAPDILTDRTEDVVLSSVTLGAQMPLAPTARDLSGNVIWYYYTPPGPNQNAPALFRPLPGGNMFIALGNGTYEEAYRWQILREIDLAGNTVRQTSVFSINLQLEARGDDRITSIHHEAIRMPNGYTALLGSVERVIPSTEGDREVLGDMVVVLDEDFQVVWTWNGFDHLDTERRAILGETCVGTQGGCPQLVNLVGPAEDWMHSNSIDYTPDGHFLVSIRHQDWVIKINYADGAGDGSVLWRLGREGDFTVIGFDDWPEQSHQHDAEIESNGLLTLFDNGNTRVSENGGNSRGQAYLLNENNMVALLLVNTDLGEYSPALGAAELLSNGNYSFSAGAITKVGPAFDTADLVETNGFGSQVYRNRQTDVGIYRHFRGSGMYDLD